MITDKKRNDYLVVIPARYESTRLPGKPLVPICGVPLLVRTFLQCNKVVRREKILVATDSSEIADECRKNNFPFMITSKNCLTGTDRVAEVASKIDIPIFINVQGDEPLFNPDDLVVLIKEAFANPNAVLCGYTRITDSEDYHSPNCPKVVKSRNNDLLYMSRSPIPGNKRLEFATAWRQVCAYSFPRPKLLEFAGQTKKTELESIEDIEILRFLELGHSVKMIPMSSQSIPVDCPDDIIKVEQFLKSQARMG